MTVENLLRRRAEFACSSESAGRIARIVVETRMQYLISLEQIYHRNKQSFRDFASNWFSMIHSKVYKCNAMKQCYYTNINKKTNVPVNSHLASGTGLSTTGKN